MMKRLEIRHTPATLLEIVVSDNPGRNRTEYPKIYLDGIDIGECTNMEFVRFLETGCRP